MAVADVSVVAVLVMVAAAEALCGGRGGQGGLARAALCWALRNADELVRAKVSKACGKSAVCHPMSGH